MTPDDPCTLNPHGRAILEQHSTAKFGCRAASSQLWRPRLLPIGRTGLAGGTLMASFQEEAKYPPRRTWRLAYAELADPFTAFGLPKQGTPLRSCAFGDCSARPPAPVSVSRELPGTDAVLAAVVEYYDVKVFSCDDARAQAYSAFGVWDDTVPTIQGHLGVRARLSLVEPNPRHPVTSHECVGRSLRSLLVPETGG